MTWQRPPLPASGRGAIARPDSTKRSFPDCIIPGDDSHRRVPLLVAANAGQGAPGARASCAAVPLELPRKARE